MGTVKVESELVSLTSAIVLATATTVVMFLLFLPESRARSVMA